MALPKLNHPTFELTIPSTKEKVKFRPYTVREQKVLLMMKESSEQEEIVQSLKDLIESCSQTKINANKFAYFDIEYIFLKLRAFSVGEISTLSYKCNNLKADGSKCSEITSMDIDLREIEVTFDGVKEKRIPIENGLYLLMNYSNLESAKYIADYRSTNNLESFLNAIAIDVKIGRAHV